MQFTYVLSIIVAEWLAILVGKLLVGRKDSEFMIFKKSWEGPCSLIFNRSILKSPASIILPLFLSDEIAG